MLTPLVPARTFESPQGMAVSRDERTLYIADYGRGLYRIDLKKPKKIDQVAPIKGIDGLLRDGDTLITIANGDGRRILRLTLDAAGVTVASQAVLATPPGPGDPTLGTIVHGRLLYVADAQWDRFDGTTRRFRAPARVTHIVSVALPEGQRPPEMRVRLHGG